MIKHLILDIGSVISHPGGYKVGFQKYIAKQGINHEIAFRIIKKHDSAMDYGLDSYKDFVKEYNEATGSNFETFDFLERVHTCVPHNEKLMEFAKSLKEVKVSILSDNFAENKKYYDKHYGFDKWMFKQVYSFQYGICKPDPRIYKILLEQLEADPSECLFVDDLEENCEAARKLGINAIHFTGNDSLFEELKKYDLA